MHSKTSSLQVQQVVSLTGCLMPPLLYVTVELTWSEPVIR
jgi:hypothetical protein